MNGPRLLHSSKSCTRGTPGPGTVPRRGSQRKARTPLVPASHRPVWARSCDRRHALERLGRRRGSSNARMRVRTAPRRVHGERATSPAVLSTVQVSGPTGELPRRRCQAATCGTTRAEVIAAVRPRERWRAFPLELFLATAAPVTPTATAAGHHVVRNARIPTRAEATRSAPAERTASCGGTRPSPPRGVPSGQGS